MQIWPFSVYFSFYQKLAFLDVLLFSFMTQSDSSILYPIISLSWPPLFKMRILASLPFGPIFSPHLHLGILRPELFQKFPDRTGIHLYCPLLSLVHLPARSHLLLIFQKDSVSAYAFLLPVTSFLPCIFVLNWVRRKMRTCLACHLHLNFTVGLDTELSIFFL